MNGVKKGRSAEEIKEQLFKLTENVIKLEKYNEGLDGGKSLAKPNRKDIHTLITQNHQLLQRSKELLHEYDGEDRAIFMRKMNNVAERFEDVRI